MADDHKNVNLKLALASIMCGLVIIAGILVLTHACGGPKKTVQTAPVATLAPPATDPACSDGSASGSKRTVDCPIGEAGSDVQVCAAGSWADAVNTCALAPPPPPPPPPPGCTVPVYANVQAIFQNCVSCHAGITTFAGAQALGTAEIARRVGLPPTDTDHMPELQAPQLAATQVAEIQSWVQDGANNTCPGTNPPPPPASQFIGLAAVDQVMVADALKLSVADQPFQRYLLTAGEIDDGIAGAALQAFADAINKGVNSLNDSGQDLTAATKVSPGVWRIDLRNYAIGAAEIATIDAADVLNIIDNTSQGSILQALVNDRHAWFHADDFLETTFRNPSVYYAVLNIPATLVAYQAQIGVNLAQDLAALPSLPGTSLAQISQIAAVGQISEQKNRLLLRDVEARSTAAWYWQTFDFNAVPNNVIINGVAENQKNLFQFPLVVGTGAAVTVPSIANFTQDASETIAQLPNGLQAYGLWDGQGNRLNAADPNVVIDTETPLANHVIAVGITCSRCHNGGTIPLVDKVLSSVTANADQFTANDVQLVQAVYHDAPTNAGLFSADSSAFVAALARLGIKPGADPQNVVGDRFQENWTLSQLAGKLLLTQAQTSACINGSAKTKATIGELTTGGTAPEADIVAILQTLIADCRLFQDPVAQ